MSSDSDNNLSAHRVSINREVRRGNLKAIRSYIKNGHDINKQGRQAWTPLHTASYFNQRKVIIILIQNCVKISPTLADIAQKRAGWTPLHLTAEKNNVKCGELLLRSGASVKSILPDVCDPLHIAVLSGSTEMVNLLLNHGADVNLRFENNLNVTKLLKNYPRYSLSGDCKLPILHVSIILRFSKITELLLSRGADINLKSGTGKTTLMQAVRVNDVHLVKYLLTKGADVNDRDIFLKPVLYFTIINDNTLVSMYCKEEFGKVNEKSDILRLLLQAEVDVNARFSPDDDNDHRSLFHYAVERGYNSIAWILLFKSDFDLSQITLGTLLNLRVQIPLLTLNLLRDRNYILLLTSGIRKIVIQILSAVISRHMLGLPVFQPLLLMLKSNIQVNILIGIDTQKQLKEHFVDKTSQMINHMKKTRIGHTNVSYWQLATCGIDELTKLAAREEILIESLYYSRINYFCYSYIFEKRLKIAKTKRSLFGKFTEILFNLYKDHLPYDCCENISTYFNHSELRAIFSYVN